MRQLFFLALITIFGINLTDAQEAPKLFKGTITYELTFPEKIVKSRNNVKLPTSVDMIINGNKAKINANLPDGTEGILIDGDNHTITQLFDINGKKVYTVKTITDLNLKTPPTVVRIRSIKDIAGYRCSISQVTAPGNITYSKEKKACYSTELGENNLYFGTPLESIKGIMLEYDYEFARTPVSLLATKVKTGKVAKKHFKISKKYKKVDLGELSKMQMEMLQKQQQSSVKSNK